jgi:hypothetical protein
MTDPLHVKLAKHVYWTLRETDGNVSQAAKHLEIGRSAVYYWIHLAWKHYWLDDEDRDWLINRFGHNIEVRFKR